LTKLSIIDTPVTLEYSKEMAQKKSLLIGINYTGSENELNGCHRDVERVAEFLSYRGYSDDPRSQIILRDDMEEPYYPSGRNILVLPLAR
jgi:hypothetical protein